MLNKVLIIAVLLSVVGLIGCTAVGTETLPANITTVREATIASKWAMKQLELSLEAETKIVLTLAAGDKVDGYFYCVTGANVTFSISGNSLIYQSSEQGKGVPSDRFSLTASQAQGIAYTLKFTPFNSNAEDKKEATVFLELIYPVTGEIFVPIGTK